MLESIRIIFITYIQSISLPLYDVLTGNPLYTVKRIVKHFSDDSLYRNSIFLMLSTGVQSFFGFFFWVINAHFYTPGQVGLATAILSITTLIANFSMLGLNSSLIRFLPKSKDKNTVINTVFTTVIITSIIAAVCFIIFLPIFSPELIIIRQSLLFYIPFIIFMSLVSLNAISDSVFIAYRSTKYILFYYIIFSLIKVTLPLLFISLSFWGIYISYVFGVISALILTLYFLIKIFNYEPQFSINISVLKNIGKFSLGNYFATFLNTLPNMILPIIITNAISPADSAYFYVAMIISQFICIIPQAISPSLFAEGSNNLDALKNLVLKSIKLTVGIQLPLLVVILIFGKYTLMIFGKGYSDVGLVVLYVLTINSIFISINGILMSILRIKSYIRELIIFSVITFVSTMALIQVNIKSGLTWIGISMLFAQVIGLVYLILIENKKHIYRK